MSKGSVTGWVTCATVVALGTPDAETVPHQTPLSSLRVTMLHKPFSFVRAGFNRMKVPAPQCPNVCLSVHATCQLSAAADRCLHHAAAFLANEPCAGSLRGAFWEPAVLRSM